MRHPFWIVNCTLALLALLALVFMYFGRVSIPERKSIRPKVYTSLARKESVAVDIAKVYENDLFGTYQKELPPISAIQFSSPLPAPPAPHTMPTPKQAPPQFLDPLDITLKGIMVISHSTAKNGAIIEDNQTKIEKNYHVGNTLEDAQLIRIFSNKIIFLRSNGQQEVLYLREQDAKIDPAFAVIQDWDHVVKKLDSNSFAINPIEFSKRIGNLAQFIDMFNLVTAYRKGSSVGVQIGRIDQKSLGTALDLESGDLITSINNIPTASTEDRIKIYKEVTTLDVGDTITVELSNRGQQRTLQCILQQFVLPGHEKTPQAKVLKRLQEEEKTAILEEKYKFAPTLHEIESTERRNMFRRGKAPQN